MKIACIGNMNNNLFCLVRYLRDAGFDAHLLLFDKEISHFHPSNDSFNLDYQNYTHNLSWGGNIYQLRKISSIIIKNDLDKFDILIGCGASPAFLAKANRYLDIFVPYGTDITDYPFYNYSSLNPLTQFSISYFTFMQRRGIRESRYINLEVSLPIFERFLSNSGYSGKMIRKTPPMVYYPDYHLGSLRTNLDRSAWYKEFLAIRNDHELMIFHHSRHFWKNRGNNINAKGTDKLIHGFAEFVKSKPYMKACLMFLEYGPDVNETKKLINELGIVSNVFWLPLMSRKEIMIGISLADIGAGEFHHPFLTYGVILEFLCLGKPIISYRREDSYYHNYYQELYPLMNANTAKGILLALENYIQNIDYYKNQGELGRKWFLKYCVEQPTNSYIEIIKDVVTNQSLL